MLLKWDRTRDLTIPTRYSLEATMRTKKTYWRIVGYDSTKKIFESEIPIGLFTGRQMSNVLRVLVARAGLTYQEILDSYVKRNTKRYRSLLEVQVQSKQILLDVWIESPRYCVSCGKVTSNTAPQTQGF